MTTNPLRAARGTTASLSTRALKDGEFAYNTETERLHVGDGVTVGGKVYAPADDSTTEVPTKAALSALTAGSVAAVTVLDRATPSDKGGGTFVWRSGDQSAKITADPQGGVWVAPDSDTDGSSGAWERQWDGDNCNACWFGYVPDSEASDEVNADAINAAMSFMNYVEGGTVLIPEGDCYVDSTLDNYFDNVLVKGSGISVWSDAGNTATYGVTIVPTAAITVLKRRSPYGATNSRKIGGGFVGFRVIGNDVATRLLEVDSVYGAEFDLHLQDSVGTEAALFKCGVTGTDLADSCTIQKGHARLRIRQTDTGDAQDAHCIVLQGSTNANVSFATFDLDLVHMNGDGLRGDGDNITFEDFRCYQPSGTGRCLYGLGRYDTDLPVGFEANIFHFFSANTTGYLEGTDDTDVTQGVYNTIIVRDVANNTPRPDAGEGSHWDYVSESVSEDYLEAGQLQSFRNRLINGGFVVNQRQASSNADDTYCFDRWYVLTQSGSVACSQLSTPEQGTERAIRITQSQASAQRIGLAQIIESFNCRDLRGVVTTLSGRVARSDGGDVRYAVLEWTGTSNSVTSDIIADWTSTSYTAGGFFNSTTLNVLAVGEVTTAAATWRDLDDLNATVGASANNIIVFVWSEGTMAQNATLDLARLQYEPGATATIFEFRPVQIDWQLCRRYYRKSYFQTTAPGTSTAAQSVGFTSRAADQNDLITVFMGETPMRNQPTVTIYSTTGASGNIRNITSNSDLTAAASAVGDTSFLVGPTANTTANEKYSFHWTAEIEL